jgi:hypothetical protein
MGKPSKKGKPSRKRKGKIKKVSKKKVSKKKVSKKKENKKIKNKKEKTKRKKQKGKRKIIKGGVDPSEPPLITSKETYSFINFNKKSDISDFNVVDFSFLDFDGNGNISKEEFSQQLKKYFNIGKHGSELIDNGIKEDIEKNIKFNTFDTNKDGNITLEELIEHKFSEIIRNTHDIGRPAPYKDSKDIFSNVKDDTESTTPKGSFKGISRPDPMQYYDIYLFIRYLVEVTGVVKYINFNKPETAIDIEETVFNLICNDKSICKYHNIPIEDFTMPTTEHVDNFLKIVDDAYKDNHNILVHCSDGTGRTGYMILIYIIRLINTGTLKHNIKDIDITMLDIQTDINTLITTLDLMSTKIGGDPEKYKDMSSEKKKYSLYKLVSHYYISGAAEELFDTSIRPARVIFKSRILFLKTYFEILD